MTKKRPIIEIIRERFSCRTFSPENIPQATLTKLQEYITAYRNGPLGSSLRFDLVASMHADSSALRDLGTYGTIQNPRAFIIGATGLDGHCLEDYGFAMEEIILYATELGLGTCWLGGFFTRSSFGKRIAVGDDEQIPAVAAMGLIGDPERAQKSIIRRMVGALNRLPWEELFYDKEFDEPLTSQEAGIYETALEMVRWAPSASNRQPWRIIRIGNAWHFYLSRTPGYRRNLLARLMNFSDLQRVDMGIAMCHFATTLQEMGITGQWKNEEPAIVKPDPTTEYCVTWQPA
jgi:nitroreductase